MTVIHNFTKRPSEKNLANRSLSFAATGEIDHVRTDDLVHITIKTKTGVTSITVEGNYFLNNLQDRTARASGTKVKIFKF